MHFAACPLQRLRTFRAAPVDIRHPGSGAAGVEGPPPHPEPHQELPALPHGLDRRQAVRRSHRNVPRDRGRRPHEPPLLRGKPHQVRSGAVRRRRQVVSRPLGRIRWQDLEGGGDGGTLGVGGLVGVLTPDNAFGSEAPPCRRETLDGQRRRAAQTSLPAVARLQECGRLVLVPQGGQDSFHMGDGKSYFDEHFSLKEVA